MSTYVLLSNWMLLCACMGSYVFNWVSFKNVSAYIFHDAFFFSFKRVLVQGRRPCFRRLYRRLCFVKCKRLHFSTSLYTIGQNWTTIGQMDRIGQNWTQIGQISDRIGQKWTIFVQNGQILEKWTNLDNSGQNLVNPWCAWVSGYFVIIFVQFCLI